jgi:cyclase
MNGQISGDVMIIAGSNILERKVWSMPTPEWKHYQVEELRPGVFALLAIPGKAAHSNSALIDLGDRSLLVDTGETVLAGEELQRISRQLTGKDPDVIVNTHAHMDHWLGNQVFFPGAKIYASRNTIERMPFMAQEYADPGKLRVALEKQMKELKRKEDREQNADKRSLLQQSLSSINYELESITRQRICPATEEVSGSLTVAGALQTCILTVTRGHTPGDVYVTLPQQKAMVMGDLGFLQCHPFMIGCDPQAWVAELRRFEGMPYDLYLPGHGPVGDKQDVKNLRAYIEFLVDRVVKALRDGDSGRDVLSTVLPKPFSDWTVGMARLERNIEYLFKVYSKK